MKTTEEILTLMHQATESNKKAIVATIVAAACDLGLILQNIERKLDA